MRQPQALKALSQAMARIGARLALPTIASMQLSKSGNNQRTAPIQLDYGRTDSKSYYLAPEEFQKHMEQNFFDSKQYWCETVPTTGRPWSVEELSVKSANDLHTLWFVLLRERNKLLTMMAEYTRLERHMPASERFEKVECSMENIMSVVEERSRDKLKQQSNETEEYEVLDAISRVVKRIRRKDQLYHNLDNKAEDGDENEEDIEVPRRELHESVDRVLTDDGTMTDQERDHFRRIRELHEKLSLKELKKEKRFIRSSARELSLDNYIKYNEKK